LFWAAAFLAADLFGPAFGAAALFEVALFGPFFEATFLAFLAAIVLECFLATCLTFLAVLRV
jgi:hypothetical protein